MYIELTRFADKNKLYVNLDKICAIYQNERGESIVDLGDATYFTVVESIEQILDIIIGAKAYE